ncbi:hypothetical protein BACSTE_01489 [Bacteroides stercoris ATCC 43183]|uniref:Uncharacterized protein n=1 Tax=Bacteroides stercoris ATCC 43183 TaxID=449673 RepID=B0NPT9_BACSE|nr:hypothetical protein BACSTE_01489 [Bacteroides stercoris ATCC 43183]
MKKYFLQLLLSFFPVCIPLFIRYIACYAFSKNRKIFSKKNS